MWKDWFLLKREKGNLCLHIFRSWYVVPSFGKISTNLLQPRLQCNLHVRCCLEHQGCILITILSFYLPHCCQCLWTKADLPKLSFAFTNSLWKSDMEVNYFLKNPSCTPTFSGGTSMQQHIFKYCFHLLLSMELWKQSVLYWTTEIT